MQHIRLFPQTTSEDRFLCLGKNGSSSLEHQGFAFDVVIQFRNRYLLPVGLQIFFLVILLFMSGMFSGLNLGLMSLDKTELQILINVGTEQEKIYAKKIQPIRNRGAAIWANLALLTGCEPLSIIAKRHEFSRNFRITNRWKPHAYNSFRQLPVVHGALL